MSDLERLVGENMYQTIRTYEDGRSLVMDVPSQTLYFKKILSVYNLSVFSWLKEHPSTYVPQIHDFWKDGDNLVVIEELIQGKTLEEALLEYLPFAERRRILLGICDGLTFLHSAEPPIIHRDLKASNVMLTADGVVKIIDYDAAKIYKEKEESDTVLMGTHGVAAPEQYGFAQSDARTDIYALGKLVARMLPESKDAMEIAGKATRMDPNQRYGSVSEMRRQIERLKEPAERAKKEEDPEVTAKKRRRMRISLIAAAIAVLTIFLLAWHFANHPAQVQKAEEERRQEISSDLADVEAVFDGGTQIGERDEALMDFFAKWDYRKDLSEEQRKRAGELGRKLLSMYMNRDSEEAESFAETLTGVTGEDVPWNCELRYLEETVSFDDDNASCAEILADMKALDEEDPEGEYVTRFTEHAMKRAGVLEKAFTNNEQNTSQAKTAMTIYSALMDVSSEAETKKESLTDALLSAARRKLEGGNVEIADAIYTCLGDCGYENVQETRNAAFYEAADKKFEDGEYSTAAELFTATGEYKDAPDRAMESTYRNAQNMFDEGKYVDAVAEYEKVGDYEDAGRKKLDAEYAYCMETSETPDTNTYDYIETLVAAGYEGAEALQQEIYSWHAVVSWSLSYSLGSMQGMNIYAEMHGGEPGGSTSVTFVIRDTGGGTVLTYTEDGAVYQNGDKAGFLMYAEGGSQIIGNTYTVDVYDDSGNLIGTKTGEFEAKW